MLIQLVESILEYLLKSSRLPGTIPCSEVSGGPKQWFFKTQAVNNNNLKTIFFKDINE